MYAFCWGTQQKSRTSHEIVKLGLEIGRPVPVPGAPPKAAQGPDVKGAGGLAFGEQERERERVRRFAAEDVDGGRTCQT